MNKILNKDVYKTLDAAEAAHKMFCVKHKQMCADNNICDDRGIRRSCKFCKFGPVQNCKMVWLFSDCEEIPSPRASYGNSTASIGISTLTNTKDHIVITIPKDVELLRMIFAYASEKPEMENIKKIVCTEKNRNVFTNMGRIPKVGERWRHEGTDVVFRRVPDKQGLIIFPDKTSSFFSFCEGDLSIKHTPKKEKNIEIEVTENGNH